MNFLNPKRVISSASVYSGSVVADFGFGRGEFLQYLSTEVGREGKVYAIDIQEDIVKKVSDEFQEKNISNTEFLVVNLEEPRSTRIADSSVDFVLISALFFQLNFRENVLSEAVRILKPGGRILFIEWRESFSGIGPEQNQIFSEDQAIMMFKNFPVDLERRIDSGEYHYALMYKKN